MKSKHLLLTTLAAAAILGCSHSASKGSPASSVAPHEGQIGTLWVTSSAEFQMVVAQSFALATERLDELLRDRSSSALAEGQLDAEDLPPAVIVDVDETVLDNSPYQAQLILDDTEYSEETWSEWVALARAEPLPGALEFVRYAVDRGVQVVYLTNRAASDEAATRRNLLSAGFPIDETRIDDVVLTKDERPGWGSDKRSRRDWVASSHRVVMLIGDDLNDFVSGARANDPSTRRALARKHSSHWGRDWIVLPNPLYGSWEASLFGRDYSLSREEKLRERNRHLERTD